MKRFENVSLEDSRLKIWLYDFRVVTSEGLAIVKPLALDPPHSIHKSPQLTFEVIDRKNWQRPNLFARWFTAFRAFSLTASVTPAVVTLLLGIREKLVLDMSLFILALFGALSLQMGVNLLNDFEDHMKLLDLPQNFGGSGVIQKGWIPARHILLVGVLFITLGIILGIPTVVKYPLPMLLLGTLALLGSAGYSSKPFGFKYRAMGDLIVLFLMGPGLTIGIAYAAFGLVTKAMLISGVIFGILAEGILHSNNLQDISADAGRGIKTLALCLTFKNSRKLFFIIYLLNLALIIFLSNFLGEPKILLAAILPLPVIFSMVKSVNKAEGPLDPLLVNLRIKAAQVHLISGVTIILSLLGSGLN